MVMTALHDGASGGILKFFLMGLLVLAAGGLVFTDVGGFFRGGIGSADAAKIGKQKLPVQQFDRTVRNALSRLGLDTQQAYQLGYIRELLNGEIRTILLQQKANDTGIQVSLDNVAKNIQKIIQPMAGPGQEPRDVLQQLLVSQGLSEEQLAGAIRREMTVNLLSNAVQSGFLEASASMATDLARFDAETRDIDYIHFKNSDFKDLEDPSDEKLTELYEATKEAYAIPEMRKSNVIFIDTKKIKDTLEISDEEIQDIYDRDTASYSEPEKRKIEQVIVSDPQEAADIAAKVNEGASLKDAVNAVTSNTTDYIPARDTERAELLDEVQNLVFDGKKADVIGPVESGLGHHVIVLNDIIAAHATPLEKVKQEIKDDLIETRLLDAQYELANAVDDYLAAGEELSTLEEELGVETKAMPLTNSFGLGADNKATFRGDFGPDAQTLIQNLFDLGEGEASPVIELADGRMAAIALEEIQDKSYRPFEELKDGLKTRWIADNQRVQNKSRVLSLFKGAQESGKALKDIAKDESKTLQSVKAIKREGDLKKPLNAQSVGNIFQTPVGELVILDTENGVAIAAVKDAKTPEKLNEDQLIAAENKLLQSIQNEAYTLYLEGLQNKYGVRVNDKLLENIYGQQSN